MYLADVVHLDRTGGRELRRDVDDLRCNMREIMTQLAQALQRVAERGHVCCIRKYGGQLYAFLGVPMHDAPIKRAGRSSCRANGIIGEKTRVKSASMQSLAVHR